MSRITKYQEYIRDFLKKKSFIKNARPSTRNIIADMSDSSDHFPGILCITIINNRCKQGGIKMHGYHLASGIEALMMVVQIINNREYYDAKYTNPHVSNMITDVISWFNDCLIENIKTLTLSNEDKVDVKAIMSIMTKCINYSAKRISRLLEHKSYEDKSITNMKKTDIFCVDFEDDSIDNYKTMKRLDRETMIDNIGGTYGTVCRLAVCLGWLIGMGDDQNIKDLELLADNMAMIIKMYDDFKNYKRDMRHGEFCTNYVVAHGFKEAIILFDEFNIQYAENCVSMGIETKMWNEIVKIITEYIMDATSCISVDVETEYDDMTSIASR
jgi:hypothetical protein